MAALADRFGVTRLRVPVGGRPRVGDWDDDDPGSSPGKISAALVVLLIMT